MRVHGCLPQHFSIGGKERELTVYDINASSSNDPIWQAKNVKNDKLDLRVPVWIRDMQFLASEHAKELVTVSSYGHIRIYDTRTARRPVLASKHGELPIKRVLAVPGSSREIIFSDTMGGMFHMDLRSMDKIAGMYKGFVGGAVEDMCVDAAHPDLVASVGIDRYMRVHEIKSRKMVHKVIGEYCHGGRVAVVFRAYARPLHQGLSQAAHDVRCVRCC